MKTLNQNSKPKFDAVNFESSHVNEPGETGLLSISVDRKNGDVRIFSNEQRSTGLPRSVSKD